MKKLLITSFILSALNVHAQDAAPVAAEVTAPAKEWSLGLEASALFTSGNTKLQTIGLGVDAAYTPNPWGYTLKGNFIDSRDNGTKKAQSMNLDLRAARLLTQRLDVFAQLSYLKNEFTGFEHRYGAELGVGYQWVQNDEHNLKTEAALGFAREEYVATHTKQNFGTGRLGVIYKWQFSKTASFGNSLNAILNFNETKDWRLNDELSLQAAMTSVLSTKVGFKVGYFHLPVSGKKDTDTQTTVALLAKF